MGVSPKHIFFVGGVERQVWHAELALPAYLTKGDQQAGHKKTWDMGAQKTRLQNVCQNGHLDPKNGLVRGLPSNQPEKGTVLKAQAQMLYNSSILSSHILGQALPHKKKQLSRGLLIQALQ